MENVCAHDKASLMPKVMEKAFVMDSDCEKTSRTKWYNVRILIVCARVDTILYYNLSSLMRYTWLDFPKRFRSIFHRHVPKLAVADHPIGFIAAAAACHTYRSWRKKESCETHLPHSSQSRSCSRFLSQSPIH